MVSELVNKSAVVFDNPFNAVLMKVSFIDHFPTRIDGQKLAGLVTIIFIFECLF